MIHDSCREILTNPPPVLNSSSCIIIPTSAALLTCKQIFDFLETRKAKVNKEYM